jgi:hypothetical protein
MIGSKAQPNFGDAMQLLSIRRLSPLCQVEALSGEPLILWADTNHIAFPYCGSVRRALTPTSEPGYLIRCLRCAAMLPMIIIFLPMIIIFLPMIIIFLPMIIIFVRHLASPVLWGPHQSPKRLVRPLGEGGKGAALHRDMANRACDGNYN